MPQYFNIVLGLFNQVHQFLNHFVFGAYYHLTLALRLPLALCITIYIVLLGYSVSHGWIRLSFSRIIKIGLKLGIIYTFAMNWSFFSHYVIDFIQQGSSQLGATLLASNKSVSGFDLHNGMEGALQSVLTHFTKIGYWLWRKGSWYSFGPCFEAIIIWASGLALIVYATLQLLVANIMLSILFVLTPVFFTFFIFKPTQLIFDRWVGHIISYALLILFVSLLLSLVLSIAEWSISGISEHNLLNSLFVVSFVPIVLICFISIALIKRVSLMAHDIGLNFSTTIIKRIYHEKIT